MKERDAEQKYHRWIITGLLLLLVTIACVISYFVLAPAFSRFSSDFYFPVFKTLNMSEQSIAAKTLLSKDKVQLANAVITLQQMNERLAAENAALRQYRNEYEALRIAASMQPPEDYNYILANVLLRNTATWFQTFTIDKGTADGIRTGDLVIASVQKNNEIYSAAVGRIDAVSNHTAVVLTLYHPDCALGAYLKKADAYGLLNGVQRTSLAQDGATIRVMGLSAEKQYKPGDIFLTSHFSRSFPADIELGTLVATYLDADGLCRSAEMQPTINMANIRCVAVLSRKE